ncbi:MAG: hypothetical protein K8U03_15985 [Planctomycetia bacterium]|nr:hypothetical protein [Planctomycetia bacterium]
MPAKLTVTAGPLLGSELWIEYEVVRIGSADDCELQLVAAGQEPHVVTLRYAEGRYLLYNRGAQPLRLDAKLVEPNASEEWRKGKTLQLPGGTSLRMETTGDGAPALRAAATALPTLAATAEAMQAEVAVPLALQSVEGAKKKQTGQAIVIALLFAAAIGVLLMDDPKPNAAGTKTKTFAELSTELRNDASLTPDLWIRFSEAYTSAYRGRADAAEVAYRRLRDRIEWEKSMLAQDGRAVPASLLEADAYVKHRLGEKR